jgi:uncharacterized protein
MSQLTHFAIHAENVKRAAKFYETVFDWTCSGYEKGGVSNEEFVQIFSKDRKVLGAIQARKFNPLPADLLGFECSFDVIDIDATARAVESAGGKIVMKKSAIPGVGWVVKFRDPEGNLCCAVTYDRTAR